MKKNKIIVSICTIIAVIAILATIFFVTNNNKEKDSLSKNDENSIADSNNNISEEQIKYWVEEYEFPKEKNEFTLNLFNLSLDTPIKLTDLEDKCDYFEYTGRTLEGRATRKVEKISEIETTLEEGSELSVYLYMNDGTRSQLTDFIIKNYSDETKTAQECIENGWWYLFEDYLNGCDATDFGMEFEDRYGVKAEMLLLEDIVKKLGRPTKIIPYGGSNPEEKNGTFASVVYNIIYEYSDFVFIIGVQEMLYLDSNKIAGFHINYFGYFSPVSWENSYINSGEGNLLK